MHPTTQEYLRAHRAYTDAGGRSADKAIAAARDLDAAHAAWIAAGYPDADPEPEAELPADLDGWTQEDGIWSHKSGSRAYLHRGCWVRVEAEVDDDARDSGCAPVLLPLDMLRTILRGADHPAAAAPSLEALADIAGALETSPLAGGADLRAELEAARADHLADVQARAAEADDLRAKLQAVHRRAQKAEAEATRLGRWTLDLRADIATLRDLCLRLAGRTP